MWAENRGAIYNSGFKGQKKWPPPHGDRDPQVQLPVPSVAQGPESVHGLCGDELRAGQATLRGS